MTITAGVKRYGDGQKMKSTRVLEHEIQDSKGWDLFVFDSVQNEAGVPVVFDNALLEQAVRAELGMPEGIITENDLARVERLAVVGCTVLSREQSFRYVIFSYVDEAPQKDEPLGDISDLSLLAKMPNLKELY